MGHADMMSQQTWRCPATSVQREAARAQLHRLLTSPLFSHSKRYPAFLRFVVEQTLSGHADELKERTIGVEVFQRDIHYDTSADPIVRVTAAEIRKRLAQYYYEPGREQEIRIELSSGSYVPAFYLPEGASTQGMETELSNGSSSHAPAAAIAQDGSATSVDEAAEGATELAVPDIAVPEANTSKLARRADVLLRRGSGVKKWFVIAAVLAIGLVFSLAIREMRSRRTPDFEQFWNQVATADGPVQICFGAVTEPNTTAPGLPLTLTAFQTAKRITDLLDQRNKSYMSIVRMLGPAATDLSQVPGGPIIFFGPWQPIAPIMRGWRYRFEPDEDGSTVWIVDAKSPGKRLWRMEHGIDRHERSESYAIAARVIDRNMKRPIIIAAGGDRAGIAGAVKALTTATTMESLLQNAPADWANMNFEEVIEDPIVDGNVESPHVVAKYFWK